MIDAMLNFIMAPMIIIWIVLEFLGQITGHK